ncbi:hypothetical protein [Bosea sp. (in: a-proteobacteria)]|uniref:hypothetical protein n=1 Tax=Bosea sp. (in: a-proteobacteria) TaxID=1871050 RepID=UPI0025C6CE87|nr:hypothetical protein [Bosea sp. (in: a-proteobacteria)]
MLHALISLFGFSKVAPKPKRLPTVRARTPSAAEQAAAKRQREADRRARENEEAIRAARAVSTIGGAADVYARHVGQVGSKPSAAYLSRAKDVMGARRLAFFQALVLAGRPIPMIPVDKIGDEGRETGFADGIDRDLNSDLDLWASVRALEERAADLARRLGKPAPEPIKIPKDIEQRLLERDRLRAAKAGGNAGGRRAPAAPVLVNNADADIDATAPADEPEKGGRGGRAGPKDDEKEAVTPPPPAPEEAEKPESDHDDEPPKGPGKP